MLTFSQLWKEIKDPIISMIPGILALFEFNSALIFVASSLTGVFSRIIEYIYDQMFCTNLENEYNASIEIHKYNERKNLNQTYRVVNWYVIKGINNSSIKVQRLVCNESSILDDDYIIRDEAVFHADYTIVPDEDYYVDIHWKDKKFQANHYVIGAKHDNPVYKIFGTSIEDLKDFEEYCLAEHRAYSKNIGKDIYKYFEWDLDEDEWCKRDIETTKTFDNIFIPRNVKNDLKGKIDTFILAKNNYQRWGIPYKLGLVFHGHPGCGKTSTIYAIANYLGRSIYLLKLDTFESNSDLYRAARHIPKDAIVVIEDIDAHRVAHSRISSNSNGSNNGKKIPVVIKRITNTSVPVEDPNYDTVSAYSEASKENKEFKEDKERKEDKELQDIQDRSDDTELQDRSDDTEENDEYDFGNDSHNSNESNCDDKDDKDDKDEKDDDISFANSDLSHIGKTRTSRFDGYDSDDSVNNHRRGRYAYRRPKEGKGKTIDSLLEIFDGYNYLPGAIVIVTTNHLGAIDPALVRPGRMDHSYLFDYATPETVNDILDFFYVRELDFSSSDEPTTDEHKDNKEETDDSEEIKENKKIQIDLSRHADSKGQLLYNKITTAEIINSIILPNICNPKKAIRILEEKLFSF